MIEYEVRIKDEGCTLCQKEVIYTPLLLDRDNANLQDKIKEVFDKFKAAHPESSDSPEITFKAKILWQ